ncbi:hypothetical protein J2X76_000446 [Neorhizobium sp. 2083]|uniref:hypothetical protein n=1 Tax=Neorhizobium sp. 2083 TaxID=2817762 RepID=UPI002861291B|nr:hypothetical protein [Neorhizobium sp. 2083]MDR6815292.1 hypothetical protein [Neorhizobium sp. 2083]
MRVWMIATGALVALAAGFSGAWYHLKPEEGPSTPKDISLDFMTLTESQPTEARRAIVEAIDTCLPQAARQGWTSPPVKNLAVDTYVRFFDLMGQDIDQGERTAQFRGWMAHADDGLSERDRAAFEKLLQGGLHQGVTALCVAATVRGRLGTQGFRGFWN